VLTTFMRHASAETSTFRYMRGLNSEDRSSDRCAIELAFAMARPAKRETSLGITSKVGRNGGQGETYLSALIESGRHGFEIGDGTSLRNNLAHLATGR
jgi:hypothetical protein